MSPVPFSLLIVSYASRRVPFLLPSVSCQRGSEEHSVPAVNAPLSGSSAAAAATASISPTRGLFVLASLDMNSRARRGKGQLPAEAEQLREQIPLRLKPNRVCAPVVLLHLMCKQLQGSEELCWFLGA